MTSKPQTILFKYGGAVVVTAPPPPPRRLLDPWLADPLPLSPFSASEIAAATGVRLGLPATGIVHQGRQATALRTGGRRPQACRRIREQPGGKGLVIIAQTGWGQEEDRRRTQEAGFDHHMVKPVDPQALMKILAGLQQGKAWRLGSYSGRGIPHVRTLAPHRPDHHGR